MGTYILGFQEVDKSKIATVGGKGANLGELAHIGGIEVPDGFCITTDAFRRVTAEAGIDALVERLSRLTVGDRSEIAELGSEIRKAIEGAVIGEDIRDEIIRRISDMGEMEAYAVRSSATAEDLPNASFAGQQDTYLNIIGSSAILKHISKCWASLFTDRAILYRLQNGFDHRRVSLAVVVQRMVFPDASGIMFTADPVSSNRKITSIDASFGLGEALVSGLVSADIYKVRQSEIIEKQVAAKKIAIYALPGGGTKTEEVAQAQHRLQALTDEQILQLEQTGRKIEAHFGCPQDIEWCLANGIFYIVQSRPITTLYPIPEENNGENHVYVSVGHQQMMTDAMKPLGLSVWQLTAVRPMSTAGGRLFVDVTPDLASPQKRHVLVNVLGKSDPLVKDALTTLLDREDFIRTLPDDHEDTATGPGNPPAAAYLTVQDYGPAVVTELIRQSEASIQELKHRIRGKSGVELIDFVLEHISTFRKSLFDPRSLGVIMTAINAASWINEHIEAWLGDKNVADIISQSVPGNVTSEMGLALLDVADAIRPYPEVIAYLQQVGDEEFLDHLSELDGGEVARDAIRGFLDKYGMRCSGEIDLTKTRWSEKPATLVPTILSNIKNFTPGAARRKFEQGKQQAWAKEVEILDRLKQLPDGESKAAETKRMIDLIRNLAGYREYPKYSIVSHYYVCKQALMQEADRLVHANVLRGREDIYYLTLEELREVVSSQKADFELIRKRKEEHQVHEKLRPPRVITSEGESLSGRFNRENLPAGALVGLPVSAGTAEGRARVILNLEDADLEPGDILVTAFTDPSWTPLFVSIQGLITEVGGLMTHGAVIAREYGLPAVVGMENATRLIQDGQRIRVHGTEGYVELL